MKLKEVLFVCSACWLGFIVGDLAYHDFNTHQTERIPFPHEIQQMLREEGYDLAVDGEIGPETMRCWNDYVNKCTEQMANELTKQEMEQ